MGTALLASIKSAIENLHPAYFAMVMATGIVSIASDLLEMTVIGVALCWLNLIFFAILLVLTFARLIWHRTRFFCDLIDHSRAPGFFTTVAATCIFWQPVADHFPGFSAGAGALAVCDHPVDNFHLFDFHGSHGQRNQADSF